jgi:hypothetical protein
MKFADLLTREEAAEFLGINPQSFYNEWRKKGLSVQYWYGRPFFPKDCPALLRWKQAVEEYWASYPGGRPAHLKQRQPNALNAGGTPEHYKVAMAEAGAEAREQIERIQAVSK